MIRKIFRYGFMFFLFLLKSPIALVQAGTELASNRIMDRVSIALQNVARKRVVPYMNTIYLTILGESKRLGFDPILLISVIETESGFSVKKRGSHGEIGLMQLKPSTGRWIAKRANIPWFGSKTLENPGMNIRLGTAYLSFLRKNFSSQHQLYLAAYNMGATGVRKSLQRQVVPKDYANRVLSRYSSLRSQVAQTQPTTSL